MRANTVVISCLLLKVERDWQEYWTFWNGGCGDGVWGHEFFIDVPFSSPFLYVLPGGWLPIWDHSLWDGAHDHWQLGSKEDVWCIQGVCGIRNELPPTGTFFFFFKFGIKLLYVPGWPSVTYCNIVCNDKILDWRCVNLAPDCLNCTRLMLVI